MYGSHYIDILYYYYYFYHIYYILLLLLLLLLLLSIIYYYYYNNKNNYFCSVFYIIISSLLLSHLMTSFRPRTDVLLLPSRAPLASTPAVIWNSHQENAPRKFSDAAAGIFDRGAPLHILCLPQGMEEEGGKGDEKVFTAACARL